MDQATANLREANGYLRQALASVEQQLADARERMRAAQAETYIAATILGMPEKALREMEGRME